MIGYPRRFHLSSRSRRLPAAQILTVMVSAVVLLLLLLDGVGAATDGGPFPADRPAVDRQGMDRGGLYFPLEGEDLFRPAPVLDTDIQGRISGLIGRFTIRHKFRNPSDDWVEGIYVFPLPPNAAVDTLRMRIGERVIEGEIQEKAQARRTYGAAKKSGRKASLVEQERPNIFTTSIANIGPGEEVSVEIEYQHTLGYDAGAFSLRLPLVVGPRYIPGTRPIAGFGGIGWGLNTAQVPDAERITPPVRATDGATDSRRGNRVALSIVLDAGFPLGAVESPSHPITVTAADEGRRRITIDGGGHRADRDFTLRWTPKPGQAPTAGLFTEVVDGNAYALLMLMPPISYSGADPGADADADAGADAGETPAVPRELVLVIDTSGSMHGPSIEQAKDALHRTLDRLGPEDRFNIIRFASHTSQLFPGARKAGRDAITRAHDYVDGLNAEGGTEMMSALRAALDGGVEPGRIRQVVLLTDGAVGNEDALFRHIAADLGDSRLFTIGIGSAPNGHFMRRAARHGRGTYTFVGEVSQVRQRMEELFDKLEHPALTHIRLAWPRDGGGGRTVEAFPDPVPDLYRGEPLVVAVRLPGLDGTVTVTGRLGGADWRTEAPLARIDGGAGNPGVGRLWARAKIAQLMASIRTGADPGEARDRALKTALAHSLVSRFTSLVAVDKTPSRPAEAPLLSRPIPTEMPHGWSREHVFGTGAVKKAKAPATIGVRVQDAAVKLPQTATPSTLHLMAGLVTLLLALTLLLWGRRRA